MNRYDEAKKLLRKYKQSHIIDFMEKQKDSIKEKLIDQVLSLDFEELELLKKKIYEEIYVDLEELQPIKSVKPNELSKEERKEIEKIGEEIIKNNKYAVVTTAGGQGTRLGHNMPKGTYKLDIGEEGKYLFEILAEALFNANKEYGITIPWYIMTSEENNKDTIDFLEEHSYFHYPKEYVMVFVQNSMPLMDEDRKLLIGKNGLIKTASNGNGDIFYSMNDKKVIEDMEKRGIEWVFISSVDNILLKMADILLIGMTVKNGTQLGTKTVLKEYPEEKVGVVCKQRNQIKVIEYTEMPNDIAKIAYDNGELVFGESHINCNLFNINALKKISKEKLNYHIAFKKANYIDENGSYIMPEKPNAYKFEKFLADAFNFFDDISILRGKREEDFAPIKNLTGVDTPETAKKLYENYWRKNK